MEIRGDQRRPPGLRPADSPQAVCLPGRLISEMQAGVDASTSPRAVSASQATRLHQILHEAKFADPSGSHLSPAGAHRPWLAGPARDSLSFVWCADIA